MKNESGIWPVEYKCLIQMLPGADKTEDGFYKSETGLVYQSQQKDREEKGREEGIFVIAGGLAFTDPDWPKDNRPVPGYHVLFDRYAGSEQTGRDGKTYRLISDKELGAILEAD